MAIDPNIALNVAPLKLRSPFDLAGEAMQMRGMQQQNESSDLALEAKRRAIAQEDAMRQLGANATVADVSRVAGPMQGAAFGKAQAEQKDAELKAAKARATFTTQVLQGVDDDASFQLARTAIASTLGPDAAAQLGEAFDPARVQKIVAQGIEAKDWIDAQFKQGDAVRANRLADNTVALGQNTIADSEAKRPGEIAKAEAEVLSVAAQKLQAATNQAEWDAALATIDPKARALMPKAFSRAAVSKAQKMGLSADKVLQAEDDARRTSEQGRHNRAMEARQTEPLEAIVGPDGKPVMVPRSQAIGKMPATSRERATEDERKAVGFYGQMRDAITTLDEVEAKLTEQELYQIQTMPQEGLIGMANRGQLSEPAKRYLRAFEQFTEARLRPVSGAAISDAEYARDRRTYAKQYSETPKLNEDRRRARDGALGALRQRAGVLAPQGESAQKKNDAPDPLGIRK